MRECWLSGHCCVFIYHPAQDFKGWLKKTPEDFSNFINICRTNSIQVLNLHGFLCRLWLYHSNDILKIKEKNAVGTGTLFQRQGTKQTQIKPNANRGLPIKLVNHIQPQLSRFCPFCPKTNLRKLDAYRYQINSPSLVNLLLPSAKLSFIVRDNMEILIINHGWTWNPNPI